MRKLVLSILLLPLIFGVSSCKNNAKKASNLGYQLKIAVISRSSYTDEFIFYWETQFRTKHENACDFTKAEFEEMYAKYILLSKEDRTYVNAQADLQEGYTIGDVIKTLVTMYYPNNNKTKNEKKKLDQSSIIIIAVVVALVGATSISILYILKNRKVIE